MSTEDRRRFFRIDDTLGVAYRVLSEEEVQREQDSQHSSVDGYTLLTRYDSHLDSLLSQMDLKQSLLRDALETMNKKINCVISQLELDGRMVQRIAHKLLEVNISACGMSFVIDELIEPGNILSLDLQLETDSSHIEVIAKVVSCLPALGTGGSHCLRVEFIDMTHHNQERLIQHIVRRQGLQLRADREDR